MPNPTAFSVKRKAVPPLITQDTLQSQHSLKQRPLQAMTHSINLSFIQYPPPPPTPSPKKKNPLKSIKKILSLSRLNTSFALPTECNSRQQQQQHQQQHSNHGVQWLPLSPLSPQSTERSAFSRPPSVLSSSNLTSPSTSPTSTSFSSSSRSLNASSCDPYEQQSCYHSLPNPEAPLFRTEPEFDLATPVSVSQKSLLTSWYDDYFATQLSPESHRRQDFLREQSEPRSFFEDDSDEEDYPISDSASEYSYSSIVPDCRDSDDGEESDDAGDEEDVTFTVGKRITCRRVSCHVVSASLSSIDSIHSSRSSTPRARRAFELVRAS